MAGFLDKNDRIIDMVLTGFGKDLLARGELRFVYWTPFDDEVDYDPPIYDPRLTGSVATLLSSSQGGEKYLIERSDQIEATLVQEATTGYKILNASGSDTTNVHRPLFDMPQGQNVIPRMTGSFASSAVIEVSQRKVIEMLVRKDPLGRIIQQQGPYEKGVERFGSSTREIDLKYVQGSFPEDQRLEGFLLRVYRSGSGGLQEIKEKRDAVNDLSYGSDLKLFPEAD